jgi:hypothetical protein
MNIDQTALATVNQRGTPATALEIRQQVNLIQSVMKAVMKENVHYGKIPGCPQPSLWKPGAEKILSTFRIAVTPEVDDLSTPDECRYRVKAVGTTPNGIHVGTGIGECSSSEEKYRWRRAVCDEEFTETDDSRKRAVWKKGKDKPYQLQQIRTNPADMANTVLKMAKKRALVDMCLTTTAASDVFTQDIEDLPEGMEVDSKPEPVKQPQRASETKTQAPAPTENLAPPDELALGIEATVEVAKVSEKSGTNAKGRAWTLYGIQTSDGWWVNTFDTKHADIAKEAEASHRKVVIEYEEGKNGKGKNLVSIRFEAAK